MNNNAIAAKGAVAAFVSAAAAFLGWKGIMVLGWVALMAIDYISGTAAAMKEGEWCSATARDGLWHKGGMILMVAVSAIADLVLTVAGESIAMGFDWPGVVMPLVLVWYIITELGSILENVIKMGTSVPPWLKKLLKMSQEAVEKAGEAYIPEDNKEED